MNEYKNLRISDYAAQLASKAPVPGGGGTAALTGAMGAALCSMVGALTSGKKKYAPVEEDIQDLMKRADELRGRFLAMIDKDPEVFAPLAKAYAMPKDTPEQIAEKERVMEICLKEAAAVPLQIMRFAAEGISIAEEMAEKGAAIAISDAGCAAALLRSSLEAAALNVYINTKFMKDRKSAEGFENETASLLENYGKRADAVYASVYGRLEPLK